MSVMSTKAKKPPKRHLKFEVVRAGEMSPESRQTVVNLLAGWVLAAIKKRHNENSTEETRKQAEEPGQET